MAMLSRVAEHLYWMSRYLERAESTARLIGAHGSVAMDLPKHARPGWASIIAITGNDPLFYENYPDASEKHVIDFIMVDESNPGSILTSIRCARENARTIRDIIPREAWEQINELFLKTRANLTPSLSAKHRYEHLDQVILSVQQITGILAGGMSHDASYEFVRLGCNLERADMTTRIVDVRSFGMNTDQSDKLKPFENILWMSVLKSLTAYQMYRRHLQATVSRSGVLKFLLQDDRFPRSFRFCLNEVHACLLNLPRYDTALSRLRKPEREIANLSTESLGPLELPQFIDHLQIHLDHVHSSIVSTYFEYPEAAADTTVRTDSFKPASN